MSPVADHLSAWDSLLAQSYAFGEPCVAGRIRSRVEDFQVDEISSVTPDGEGEHLLVHIRKSGANTDWVAGQLARALGIERRDVGYAGRKDRHAVTTQWFSARLPGVEPSGWQQQLPPGVAVLASERHRRKLRVGSLRGNRFKIVIRDLDGETETLAARAQHVAAEGVPNYFGTQRFGRGGSNLSAARAMFAEPRRRIARGRRGLLLSAARAYIFNAVLARRVADASWNCLLTGDVAGLAGSHSVFAVPEVDDTLRQRILRQDIHPTGPLWGRGDLMSRAAVRELELAMAGRDQEFAAGLEAAGLEQARRPLRLIVEDLALQVSGDVARISFALTAGGYATAVLRELVLGREMRATEKHASARHAS